MINSFKNEYEFLSNFYECFIMYNGITYRNVEAAYQAQKCPERASEFSKLSGAEAKKLGRTVSIRADWEDIKLKIMKKLIYLKFELNPALKEKLLATKDKYIEEGNWWGDTYWGVCTNKKYNHIGENHLGKIIMETRQIFKDRINTLETYKVKEFKYKPKETWEYYIDNELDKLRGGNLNE